MEAQEAPVVKACARCGQPYNPVTDSCLVPCVHSHWLVQEIDVAHTQRIQAAYAFGKRFNPDHDDTNYFEQTREPVTDYKDRARSIDVGSL